MNSIIHIFIIFILYLLIYLYILAKNYKKYIYNNWTTYKCNPLIIPFTSFFNPNVSSEKNATECLTVKQFSYYKILLGPLYGIFDLLKDTMTNTSGVINNMRGKISIIRNRSKIYLEHIMGKFTILETNLRVFIIKFKAMISKLEAILDVCKHMLLVISSSMEWIFNIPALVTLYIIITIIAMAYFICLFFGFLCIFIPALAVGVGLTYCFDENTLIKMEDGSFKKISSIKIGERIYLGGIVNGTMKSIHYNDIYNYKGVFVSGSHKVFEDTWKEVKYSRHGFPVSYKKPYLYCLFTENNLIITDNNIIFTDFDEINHIELNASINHTIINHLNKNTISRKINTNLEIMYCGFDGNTRINNKKIKYIKLHELLGNDCKVSAIIKYLSEDIVMYNYNNIIVSGSTPILEDKKWIRVYESKYAIKIKHYKKKYIYHLATTNLNIPIQSHIFRDFMEYKEKKITNEIDSIVLEHLNNNKKKSDLNYSFSILDN